MSEPPRLASLDAFRGATIAAMILVNNPGSWAHVYPPLAHAAWHGWTPTDLVFPFFLFIVGVALQFSRRSSAGEALRRAAILAGLGLFLAAFPRFDLATVRIPGVLQRIAACYLAAFLIRRALPAWRAQAGIAAALLALYWLLLTRVPVPGVGGPSLEPETNLAAWLDRLVLDGHLWKQTKTWDPEGILSTVPAVATTLLGALAGAWLRAPRPDAHRAAGLGAAGAVLMAAGLAWHAHFPINKNLWTSSYVLFTGGAASVFLGAFFFLVDVRGLRAPARPFCVYGRNAILVFVASGLLAKALGLVRVGGASLQAQIHGALFASWLPPHPASLAYALANVAFWYAILVALDRRGIHLKV